MKTLELPNGQLHQAAESIWELQLGKFLDLMALLESDDDRDDLLFQMKLLATISDIPMEAIEQLDYDHFLQIVEHCTFAEIDLPTAVLAEEIGQADSKAPITFTVKDEVFHFQPDYCYMKLKDAARVEDMLKGKDLLKHLDVVLCLTAFREGEEFDISTIDAKQTLLRQTPMEQVFRPILFFFFSRSKIHFLHKSLWSNDKSESDRIERILNRWGWYRIASELASDGGLGNTIQQVNEVRMLAVLEHLAYLKDASNIARLRQAESSGRIIH